MSLTAAVSGPKSSESQVRTALASQGFQVLKTDHDHRFPPDESEQPVAFVTCIAETEQLDQVVACAQTLGYRLRLHHNTLEPQPPSPGVQLAATLADMRREIDELKARVA